MTYRRQEPNTICEMFGAIAENYDLGNSTLSFGFHRLWNRILAERVVYPCRPKGYLDLCCGTGEIALSYLRLLQKRREGMHPRLQIYLVDFCSEMLRVAQKKLERIALPCGVQFICGDAQRLPFPDASMDCITIAYGLRNVLDRQRCLEEVQRVLRPGGCVGILELTRPKNAVLGYFHHFYLQHFIPKIGGIVMRNREAYDYLQSSIHQFIEPDEVLEMLENSRLVVSRPKPLLGGIATLFCAHKRC